MSQKVLHEVRDPIHSFVHFDNDEKTVIGSPYYQRLRYIRQLSMTSMVYPAATHSRFEHCLGVMELAGRVFDSVTDIKNKHSDSIEAYRDEFDDIETTLPLWRRHLRMAALLHDVGHPPLSHATEELFRSGMNHEHMTKELILNSPLTEVLTTGCKNGYDTELVAKLAVGPKYFDVELSQSQQVLHEIIGGDAFGVDRMDYLLRDSYHTGAVAGRFDHYRLIETLRILAWEKGTGISIGIEHGGIHPTEGLLMARYFMYMQVYLHRVSTAYNLHCREFWREVLVDEGDGNIPDSPSEFLGLTDNEIFTKIFQAAKDNAKPGHENARRIMDRNHFQEAYSFDSDSSYLVASEKFKESLAKVLEESFDPKMYHIEGMGNGKQLDSPVLKDDFPLWNRRVRPDEIVSGIQYSRILKRLVNPYPVFVMADRNIKDDVNVKVEELVNSAK